MAGRGTMRGTNADNHAAKLATREGWRALRISRDIREAYNHQPMVMAKYTFEQFVEKLEKQARRSNCSILVELERFMARRAAQQNSNKRPIKAQHASNQQRVEREEIRQAFLRLSKVDQAILSVYDLAQLRDKIAQRRSRIANDRKLAITEKEKAWISLLDKVQAVRDDKDRHRVDGLHEFYSVNGKPYPTDTLNADRVWLEKLSVANWPLPSQKRARALLIRLQRLPFQRP